MFKLDLKKGSVEEEKEQASSSPSEVDADEIMVDLQEQSEFRPGALAAFEKHKLEEQAQAMGFSLVSAGQ